MIIYNLIIESYVHYFQEIIMFSCENDTIRDQLVQKMDLNAEIE